jgi:hypothetical protein
MLQRNCFDHPEELDVLGIRAGPPAFDEMDTEFIQLLRDTDLVLRRKTDIFRLRAVAERRVIDFQRRHPAGRRYRFRRSTPFTGDAGRL